MSDDEPWVPFSCTSFLGGEQWNQSNPTEDDGGRSNPEDSADKVKKRTTERTTHNADGTKTVMMVTETMYPDGTKTTTERMIENSENHGKKPTHKEAAPVPAFTNNKTNIVSGHKKEATTAVVSSRVVVDSMGNVEERKRKSAKKHTTERTTQNADGTKTVTVVTKTLYPDGTKTITERTSENGENHGEKSAPKEPAPMSAFANLNKKNSLSDNPKASVSGGPSPGLSGGALASGVEGGPVPGVGTADIERPIAATTSVSSHVVVDSTDKEEERKRKRRRRRIIIVVIILLIVGLILLLIFLLRKDEEQLTLAPSMAPTVESCPEEIVWEEAASTIHGPIQRSQLGYPVSLSGNGNSVVSTEYEVTSSTISVLVKVYIKFTSSSSSSSSWSQRGSSIRRSVTSGRVGRTVSSVALSNSGEILAVGRLIHQTTDPVRVYAWEGSSWTSIGSFLSSDGELSYGDYIALSADGLTLAVSCIQFRDENGLLIEGTATGPGYVQVFRRTTSGSQWSQLGSNLSGKATGHAFGASMSLSRDGNLIAIGAPRGHDDNGTGYVRVYQYNGESWILIGDLQGDEPLDYFGSSVSLAATSTEICVAASGYRRSTTGDSYANVHCAEHGSWIKIGNRLNSTVVGDAFAWDISLSSDGMTLAGGAPGATFDDPGHVRIFQRLGDRFEECWVIDGSGETDDFGYSLSLSAFVERKYSIAPVYCSR